MLTSGLLPAYTLQPSSESLRLWCVGEMAVCFHALSTRRQSLTGWPSYITGCTGSEWLVLDVVVNLPDDDDDDNGTVSIGCND